jgi:branched-subunit amino acid transport protein
VSRLYFWQNVIFLGVATLMIRASFFYLYSYISIPRRVKSALRSIPMAVLPALTAPAVFFHKGEVLSLGGYERPLALVLALLVCYKTKNVFVTVLSGLVFLYVIKLWG